MKTSTKARKSLVGFTKTKVQTIHHKAEAKLTKLHAAKTEQNATKTKQRMTKTKVKMTKC